MTSMDQRFELLIGRVLRAGVILSSVCLAAGLVLSMATMADAGATLLNAGILLLIATPGARVAFSLVQYAVRGDWLFTVLTSVVLIELIAGAVAALVFHRRL